MFRTGASFLLIGSIFVTSCGGGDTANNDGRGGRGSTSPDAGPRSDSGGVGAGTASGGSSATSGAGGSGPSIGGSGTIIDSGSPVCDDGIDCTIDYFVSGSCTHSVGPSTGVTACGPGHYCTVKDGCVAAPACASAADCEKTWAGDACKTNIACDAASSVCTFDVLDKDKDGHSPSVCGGDDCDDSDSSRHPGAIEACDGKDNDCDGTVDNGATCPSSFESCDQGSCVCQTEHRCGNACVDKNNDAANCGTCGNACSINAVCNAGACSCPSGTSSCPTTSECADTSSDSSNCGACGSVCPPGATCTNAACVCPGGGQACGQSCVDVSSDTKNCGACGNVCGVGASCVSGACSCVPGPCPATIADGLHFPTAIAVDSAYVYWGARDNSGKGIIQRRTLSGGAVEQVLSIGVAGDYIRTLSLSASEIFFTTDVPSCQSLCGEAGWVDKVGFGRHYFPSPQPWMPVGLVGTDAAAYLLDRGYRASGPPAYWASGSLAALSPLTAVTKTTLKTSSMTGGGGTHLAMQGDTLYVADDVGITAVPLTTGTGWNANASTDSIKWTVQEIATDTNYVYGIRYYFGSALFRIPIGTGTFESMQTSTTGGHLAAAGGYVYIGGTEILKVASDGTATQLASALDVHALTTDVGNVYWTNGEADGAVLSIAR